jgi:hypothetical protein
LIIIVLGFFPRSRNPRKKGITCDIESFNEDFCYAHANKICACSDVFFKIAVLPLMRDRRPLKPFH